MKNINFEDGYKEFTINNDPERTIRFNPSDIAIVERFHEASRALEKLIAESGEKEKNVEMKEDTVEAIGKLDKAIREQIDYIFNQPVSETVFGKQSPMAPVGGKMLFERFLEAVLPVITTHIQDEKKASAERIGKYVNEAQKL